MFFSEDSPLRRMPTGLDRRRVLYIDAVETCFEMIDAAYTRLLGLIVTRWSPEGRGAPDLMPALAEAWSVVDWVHRLRRLLDQMPGIKKRAVGYQLFWRRSKGVEDLRHMIQHLDRRIDEVAAGGYPAMGTLAWYMFLDAPGGGVLKCAIGFFVPGRLFKTTLTVDDASGKRLRAAVDHVTLRTSTTQVSISDVVLAVLDLASAFEAAVGRQLEMEEPDWVLSLEPVGAAPGPSGVEEATANGAGS